LLQGLARGRKEALTIFLPSGMTTDDVAAFLQKTPKTESIPYDAVRLAATSPTGSVLFWGLRKRALFCRRFQSKKNMLPAGTKRNRCFR